MTDREKQFISNYLEHFNASKAARDAGYAAGTAGQQGYELLHKPHIKAKIDKYMESAGVNTQRITAALAKIGFADHDSEDEAETTYSPGDTLSALDKLAKINAMYTENVNHSGDVKMSWAEVVNRGRSE